MTPLVEVNASLGPADSRIEFIVPSPIPEPSSTLLGLVGLTALLSIGRRRDVKTGLDGHPNTDPPTP